MNLIEITALLSFLMDVLAFMSIDFGLMASISYYMIKSCSDIGWPLVEMNTKIFSKCVSHVHDHWFFFSGYHRLLLIDIVVEGRSGYSNSRYVRRN